jgi:sigma-B regulation protein RsbQ
MRAVILAFVLAVALTGCVPLSRDSLPFPSREQKPPKPKPVNVRAGPGTYTAEDGTTISYEVHGKGEPTLVFIHCWACDRTYWRHQIAAFSRTQRVLVMDLAGHGTSGKDRKNWTVEGLGDDVAGLVKSLGLPDVVLIGHSMGGPVALFAASKLPGKVRGVACADTLHNVEQAMPREMVDQLAASFEKDFPGTVKQMVQAMFPPDGNQEALQEVQTKAATVTPGPAVALMRDFTNLDLKQAMADAHVPVRCINAAPRPPFTPETAIETNRRYADFDAVLMQDIGHYLQLERPQDFDENLRWVLKDFPKPPEAESDD